MIVLYFLAALVLLFFIYVCFLAVCSLFVNPKTEYEKNSRFYRFLLNSATAAAIKLLRIRIHTSGLEKVPPDVKPLFVSNHRSNYDPIITWHVFKKWQIAFISKAANFKIPFFGWFIRKCCFMAIDRENPRKAAVTINRAAKLLNRQEVSVGVYPEGTRSKSGELLPFHNCVFKIAKKAGVPIVVLSVKGTDKIYKNIPFHRSDIYINVVDVIPPDAVKNMKTDEIGQRVRQCLKEQV